MQWQPLSIYQPDGGPPDADTMARSESSCTAPGGEVPRIQFSAREWQKSLRQ